MDSNLILSVAAIIGGLVTICAALLAVYKIARKIDDAIGVDEKGRSISDRLGRVEHQLWPNGGSSLADQVHKIEASMTKTGAEVEIIKDFLMSGQLPVVAPEAQPKPRAVRKKAS